MTTLRPERAADGPMSYEDTGQFAAVVQQLNDPLNDPLPDRPPAVPDEEPTAPGPPEVRGEAPVEAPPVHQDPQARQEAPPVRPGAREQSPAARPFSPPAPPFYARPFTSDLPSAPPGATPWFGAPEPGEQAAPAWTGPAAPGSAGPGLAGPEPVRPEFPGRESVGQETQPPGPVPPDRPEPVRAEPFVAPEPVVREAFVRTERVRPPRALEPEDVAETAQLPMLRLPLAAEPEAEEAPRPAEPPYPAPFGAPDGQQLAGAEDSTRLMPPVPPAPATPADGGRAARRKAARQGGGHRARGRGPGAGPAVGATSAAEPSAPLSRIEARRAAKAAKDSPSVVISRIVGEVFITTGVIMLLFVTYQLWWTNVRAHQQANSASNKLEQQWQTTTTGPSRAAGTFSPGQGFAIMYIPKLDVKAPIAQGVDKTSVLDKGMIGHYDGSLNTAMPWDKSGNFAVAAHRNTHGEPFRYINRLVPGDKVVVETATTYYTYEITSALASTPPTNIAVLQPVPPGSGFTGPGRYLTLTTCTPEYTSTNRLIVWGKLIEERPRSKGKPDALVQG
ncbi:class E sortase [Streptomyces polygonati]|uniref:Class E sortase n=1 Tax=Streptomyces polygonati TaxID=1617087 RepID=A0ABV8HQA4_9ACTN